MNGNGSSSIIKELSKGRKNQKRSKGIVGDTRMMDLFNTTGRLPCYLVPFSGNIISRYEYSQWSRKEEDNHSENLLQLQMS
jgi:hypothetical protein